MSSLKLLLSVFFCVGVMFCTCSLSQAEPPVLAHWKFDEVIGNRGIDSSGNGFHAITGAGSASVRRVRGVSNGGLLLTGSHSMYLTNPPQLDTLSAVTFSVWVLPTRFDQYNEIYRKEDGDRRVLFSFQDYGKLLSLGLNINGYIECDASVDTEKLLDGRWHHCAASFDGTTMRIYLDGVEAGNLERSGSILAGGPTTAKIASSVNDEFFQGAIDELIIYSAALSADEIMQLTRSGQEAMKATAIAAAGDEPELDIRPLAQWKFNEVGFASLIKNTGSSTDADVMSDAMLFRRRGVHGNAIDLAGMHSLPVRSVFTSTQMNTISLSAWVRPTAISYYREIFRQESGDKRVLFSFQENGTILAFGLDIGGYLECDARLDPAILLDGQWHHCAASFDGAVMRVFLDGREIGTKACPGYAAIAPMATGYIGSSAGASEHYEGGLDDLRIYDIALTEKQLSSLFEKGQATQEQLREQQNAQIASIFKLTDSFSETLAQMRERIQAEQINLTSDLVEALQVSLSKNFPDESHNLAEWTGIQPLEYVLSDDDSLIAGNAQRLVELALEYKPLTPEQWAQQSEQEKKRWEETGKLAEQYTALVNQGTEARFSPRWFELMLEAGKNIAFRPYVSEPVAPYMTPQTPETRDYTAQETREMLERDWLHQADYNPTPARILQEIEWDFKLADRIEQEFPGEVDYTAEKSQLAALQAEAEKLAEPDKELYFKVCEIKRAIMLRNPVINFDKVVFTDQPYPQGSEWPHETRHRLGYMAVPGGRLLSLQGLGPDGKVTQLAPQAPLHGSFWRPDVSWDGQKVLFCFKPHNEKSFHLYEAKADGSGLKQLTSGKFDDFDPIYLPDDKHIMFLTTRGHIYVRCMPPTNAFIMARADIDGKNIYLISASNEPDYLPSVMNDGRVIFTRWEYTDKPLWRAQGLWSCYPDGTQVATLWGNQSVWPDLLKDARSIPGSQRIMFTGCGHHDWFAGSIGIIDPAKGLNFPNGLTKITSENAWPEVGNGPVDPIESADYHVSGSYSGYTSPYPLSERDFLVSARRNGKFVLYLMDVNGNRELIYEGVHNVWHAMPLAPRPRPMVMPDMVNWPTQETKDKPAPGLIFSSDVYQGAPEELRGKAHFLRILTIEPKTYTYWNNRPYLSTGPVVSAVQSEGVKRIIGSVPIAKDGSVSFIAPAGKPLHFQLLDENGRALQTMRSFVGVLPGENRGCLGCHEAHSKAPLQGGRGAAVAAKPATVTPPPWGNESIGWERFVRPVLNKYCASCHEGDGKARKTLDLTPRAGQLGFDESYWLFTGYPSWGSAYQKPDNPPPGFGIADTLLVEAYSTVDPVAYVTPAPLTRLSYSSRLINIAASGMHHGVKVDPMSLQRLIAWVDTMCPYIGAEEIAQMKDPEFQGSDWLAVKPRLGSAPHISRPGPVD